MPNRSGSTPAVANATNRASGTSPRAFDGAGNYTLGLREQIVFPEIDFDKVEKVKGLNITFVTTAENDEEAKELLAQLGMPFRS